jgi:ADP-ribose pyrophosphatase YjhB (NUDIX family)
MLTVPAGKLEDGETFEQAAIRELEEEGALYVQPSDLTFVRDHTCGKMQCKQYCVDYSKTQPSSVITADRLTDLKFRTASEINNDHAPKLIAHCIAEVMRQGTFLLRELGGPGLKTTHSDTVPPGFSATANLPRHPAFEVKPAVAEADGTGPSLTEDYTHSHICPMCGTEYTHSHKHDKRFVHKPRAGACPNASCPHHKSACKKSADALTSSEQRKVRQSSVSSPVNGNGTPHPGKGVGQNKAGKTSGKGLSHPPTVNQNAGKSHASVAESKGKGKSTKLVVVPQTAAAAMTLVPSSTHKSSIVDEVSRVSEGQQSAVGGVLSGCASTAGTTFAEAVAAEQAGISGHQISDGGDVIAAPPGLEPPR